MNFKTNLLTIIISYLMISFTTVKKVQPINHAAVEGHAIVSDTSKVKTDEPPKKKVYQATNTKANDIIHTKLWVSFDWQKSQLIGKAEIELKPYFYPTNMLYLNARGMEIKSLQVHDKAPYVTKVKDKQFERSVDLSEKPNTYIYENDSLKINLGRYYSSKEIYYVTIEYISKPNELKKGGSSAISADKGLYFINPTGSDPNKMPQIWTQGESQSNSSWFPTIDNPSEKMTNEIYMTVDNKYTTLSNGLLIDTKKNSNGTRVDHWKMDLPHAPYLVMMAVGEFKKVVDEPWNGKEISYYVEKEYEPHAKAIFGKTKKMIDFYSKKLGVPYAWPKYSQIVVRDYVSGAMENTTATLHGDFVCYQTTREMIDNAKGESTIAHELFHQWFGDLASCESWSNLTLNESFATYGEYLWAEFENGRDAADDEHADSGFGYWTSAERKQVDLVRFDYENREDMFDAFSYNKGGQILHMLRKYVGDDAFFASLKLYLEKNKFKTAEAHDLRLAFEEITGEDLNWFFNEWYFAKGNPVLSVNKSYDAATKKLSLTVNQEQDFKISPLYRLPIDIDIYVDGKKERKRIWIDDVKNSYSFTVSSNPSLVNFDAERQLLAKINYEKTKEEYIFQYKNAPLWGDRNEAIEYFEKQLDDKVIFDLVKTIALKDPWKEFRKDAIELLGTKVKDNEEDLKSILVSIYNNDINTTVKAKAIETLSKNFTGNDLNTLYEKAIGEQSYAIVSEALKAISKSNPELALQKAKMLETESSKKIIISVADVYATNGTDENVVFFKKIRPKFSGYELMGYLNYYGKFLKHSSNPQLSIDGANELTTIADTDNKYLKYTALKVMKDVILKSWQEREEKLNSKIEKAKTENLDLTVLNTELKIIKETVSKILEIYNSVKK